MIGGLQLRVGPIARLSLGLVALIVSLALVADMLLGVVPARGDAERRMRQRVAETLALQITALVEAGDTALLGRTLQQVLARDARIRSIAVTRSDGTEILRRGVQPQADGAADGAAVSAAGPLLSLPVTAGRERWGDIEIGFAADEAAGPWWASGLLAQPAVQMLLVLALGGFALCYAYLWRAMHFLNPSASVPDRVRRAFDALAEGLLIVDQQQRIVLANRAFRQLHPQSDAELNGQPIDSLPWLQQGFAAAAPAAAAAELQPAAEPLPWVHTLQTGDTVSARPLQLPHPGEGNRQLLVSTAAITDNSGRARGCLITFDDVTAVHRANGELRSALDALEQSRRRIEEQNVELRQLASRDGLTGCYNRRAFFELAIGLFNAAREHHTGLCCLMVDIDHFKRFNDTYGHAVGDQVIQVVSRTLAAGLRQPDLLGRYGGEEFCIVLPGADAQAACVVAERMRAGIESTARSAIRGIQVIPITASFGVAVLEPGVASIESADRAGRPVALPGKASGAQPRRAASGRAVNGEWPAVSAAGTPRSGQVTCGGWQGEACNPPWPAPGTSTSMAKAKHAPPPSRLDTSMSEPMARTSSRLIARPRPVPAAPDVAGSRT